MRCWILAGVLSVSSPKAGLPADAIVGGALWQFGPVDAVDASLANCRLEPTFSQ